MFSVQGPGLWFSGLRVCGLWLRVQGIGFRVVAMFTGEGFTVFGLRSGLML